MNIQDLLYSMRSGEEQSDEAVHAFVVGVTNGSISRPQAAAWLAWAFQRGLTEAETLALTRAMTHSGAVLAWGDGPPCIDKHSTGGVGDKVSLILAPLYVELGYRVPMISGRGLGHTGGTLDKLEAIRGYDCNLDDAELARVLRDVGCFISGQTSELAPADRVLYGLRNETSTVESIPLIVGSILSKKLAEGVEQLVLDVKTGSGAFMKTYEDSHRLASALVRVATGAGVRCSARITRMDCPLGHAVGNAVEVHEAIACLKGGGPDDLRQIVLALADDPRAEDLLASGRCYETFARMVSAQGGDLDDLQDGGVQSIVIEAPRAGIVQTVDALGIGRAAFELGAGRSKAEDPVDFAVGVIVPTKPGDVVQAGQPLATVLHRGLATDQAVARVRAAIRIGDAPVAPSPLVLATL